MSSQQILLFTKTTGYRHAALAEGVDLVAENAQAQGLGLEHTEDEAVFSAGDLAAFDAVVWLQVSGDVLDEPGREAFGAYLREGGGFAGVHGAADAEWSWPEYESIMGARFLYHPRDGRQEAVLATDPAHPSTSHLPESWTWTDEWYAFTRDPSADVDVLLTIDESTYDPEEQPMGASHPVCWTGRYGRGRTWYSALGHHTDHYADEAFRRHLWGGITSVLRA